MPPKFLVWVTTWYVATSEPRSSKDDEPTTHSDAIKAMVALSSAVLNVPETPTVKVKVDFPAKLMLCGGDRSICNVPFDKKTFTLRRYNGKTFSLTS